MWKNYGVANIFVVAFRRTFNMGEELMPHSADIVIGVFYLLFITVNMVALSSIGHTINVSHQTLAWHLDRYSATALLLGTPASVTYSAYILHEFDMGISFALGALSGLVTYGILYSAQELALRKQASLRDQWNPRTDSSNNGISA